jgi:hypothetical protein
VRELGWQDLTNGKLLKAAEDEGFSILITVDKNMRHQQNLKNFTVNLVTIDVRSIRLADLIPILPKVEALLIELESEKTVSANLTVTI